MVATITFSVEIYEISSMFLVSKLFSLFIVLPCNKYLKKQCHQSAKFNYPGLLKGQASLEAMKSRRYLVQMD